jgi:hypothetical protein
MVSSVSNLGYYSYLSVLQGGNGATSAPQAPVAPTPSATAAATTAATQEVSSLLNGGNSFAPEVLSLLQQNSSGSFDPITSLLGGTSTNNALTSIYANLYAGASAAALTQVKNDAAPATTPTSPVQSLINASAKASVAYNQTNLQNSQSVVNNNSYQADGVTPLVA